MRRFDGLVRGLQKVAQMQQRGTFPTVGLQATYATGNQFTEFFKNWNAVLVVDVPLFESGLTRSRTRQARHEVARAEQNRELVREHLQLAKKTSLLRLRELEKKIMLGQEALLTAQENFEQNKINYTEGTVLNTDVLEAQLLLNDAKVTLNNSLYDYISFQAEFAKHVGRLDEFLATVVGVPGRQPLPAPAPHTMIRKDHP